MTFTQIKQAILDNAKQIEICDTLQEAMVAADFNQLVTSGIPTIEYAYQSGIITDSIIEEIPETNMNSQGVYTQGVFTLTNPEEIFVLKNANVTINLTAAAKCKMTILGSGTVSVNMANNSYCSIKAYGNSVINLIINNAAICNLQTKEKVSGTVALNNNAVMQLVQLGFSDLTLVANDTSALLAKLYGHSMLTYSKSKSSSVNIATYNASQAILSA